MLTSLLAASTRVSDLAGAFDLAVAHHTAVVLVTAARAHLAPTLISKAVVRPVPVVAQRTGFTGQAGVASGTSTLLRTYHHWAPGHLGHGNVQHGLADSSFVHTLSSCCTHQDSLPIKEYTHKC